MVVAKTKYKLIVLPNKKLRQSSTKIGIVSDETREIIQSMSDTVLAWEDSRDHEVGVALAAIQIGVSLRIIIIRNDFEDKKNRGFRVFINPTITKYEGPIEEDFEGCLSIKDIYAKVPRYHKVRIKAKNIEGHEIRVTAEGFLARIFQHEVDHTNGRLFIDHIKDIPDAFYELTEDGSLKKLDYEKHIKNSRIFW